MSRFGLLEPPEEAQPTVTTTTTWTLLYHSHMENFEWTCTKHNKLSVSWAQLSPGDQDHPPPMNNKAQLSAKTDHENSFKIKASRLWNTLPKSINTATSLESFKAVLGNYIKKIPDTPPIPGHTAINRNSLLDWSKEKGGRTWCCWPDVSPTELFKCIKGRY